MSRYHGFRVTLGLFVLFNTFAFGMLYFYKDQSDYTAILYGIMITFLCCITAITIITKGLGDQYLFLIISMLLSISCIMLYRLDQDLILKHIIWIVLGTMLFLGTYFLYDKYASSLISYAPAYFLLSVFLFAITLIFGQERNGAKNWLGIGVFTFQPSELIKILFILFLASYTYSFKETIEITVGKHDVTKSVRVPRMMAVMLLTYILILFLVLQEEWGTALEFFIIFSMMTYVFERNRAVIIINTFFAVFGSFVGYFIENHIRIRVDIWLNPWADMNGKGYQIVQSLFAMAAGGFFGKGIGLGSPQLVPNVTTDFIFSAICEEMGIFGGCAVVLLYFILVYRGIKVSLSIKEPFHKKIALGITVLIGIQTFLIIGGVTKMIPLTGVTLPFISYGGSSIITNFITLGILQAVSNKSRDKEVHLR